MGSHPINLAVRFLLEISALVAMGAWGWRHGEGWIRFTLAGVIPLLAAVLWDTFAVPDDPSRSGAAPIPIPGILRLALEIGFFVAAIWAVGDLGFPRSSWGIGVIVVMHYVASYDRVLWLLKQ